MKGLSIAFQKYNALNREDFYPRLVRVCSDFTGDRQWELNRLSFLFFWNLFHHSEESAICPTSAHYSINSSTSTVYR